MRSELIELCSLMSKEKIDACLVPIADGHGSEYVHPHFMTLAHVSGFTGDAAWLLVLADSAYLWTDGRFFLQAGQELEGSGITLMKSGKPGVPDLYKWLHDNFPKNGVLALDGRLVSAYVGQRLEESISKSCGILNPNFDPSRAWKNRPPFKPSPVHVLGTDITGRGAKEKLNDIRREMAAERALVHIMASLDDIAWTLNLRGSDIPCNPVFYSWLVVRPDSATLYINDGILTDAVCDYLAGIETAIRPYGAIYEDMAALPCDTVIMLNKASVNCNIVSLFPKSAVIADRENPATLLKAVKNKTEQEHLISCHIRDGAAVTRFIYRVKNDIGKIPMTEISATKLLERMRCEAGGYLEPSFPTIAGYAHHSAIVHYTATEDSDISLMPEGFLLVDSGGQYVDGTTDITRTIALGPVSDEMRTNYTLVLKGTLNLAAVRFAHGCTGANLDILARRALWDEGLDFRHGTGHGVGFRLNVHEGPNRFAWKYNKTNPGCVLEEGMVTTDEPGFYKDGEYGIRLENELLCRQYKETEYGRFLEFYNLTLCPYDRAAINPQLLSERERTLLNNYHRRVYETLAPLLENDEAAWLKAQTAEI